MVEKMLYTMRVTQARNNEQYSCPQATFGRCRRGNLLRLPIFLLIPEFGGFCRDEGDEGGVINPYGDSDDNCIDTIDFTK